MAIQMERSFEIYTIEDGRIYALLKQASCDVIQDEYDRTKETLVLAETVRYENTSTRADMARFDVYCDTGFAFTLVQLGTFVQEKFLLHHPASIAFPRKFTFREALAYSNLSIEQLSYNYPYHYQSVYDMTANLPVTRQQAAFVLAKMSISSRMVFTFDTVDVNIAGEDFDA